MNETGNTPKEIDIFEFIELIIKRKYLIIVSLIVSIIMGSLYSYLIIYSKPEKYLIRMVIHLSHDQNLNQNLFNQVNGWFYSGAYKEKIKKIHRLNIAPEIETRMHQKAFVELKMHYSDAAKGKKILKSILEVFAGSEFLKKHLGDSKDKIIGTRRSAEINYKKLKDELGMIKEKINGYSEKINNNMEKIAALKGDLKKSQEFQREASINGEKNELKLKLYFMYREKLDSFINYIDRNNIQQKDEIFFENVKLKEIENKMIISQEAVSFYNKRINKLENQYTIESPPEAIRLPLNKTIKAIKTIGMAIIIGLFFGAFLALLLGIKERRHRE
tara:strand:+ start:2175 stop:3167 length:993 start_codon:yes stop_codon:yes gene_type:complete